jgi:Ca2+/Na+ antiporter
MIALGRLVVIGFVVLTVIYVALSYYSRAVRKSKLAREWDEEDMQGDKDGFIEQGLADYDGSLRRKLILGVYVIPVIFVSLIVYLNNFN